MKVLRYEDTVTSGDKVTAIYGSYIPDEDKALISMHSFFSDCSMHAQTFGVSMQTAAALAKILFRIVRDGAVESVNAEGEVTK